MTFKYKNEFNQVFRLFFILPWELTGMLVEKFLTFFYSSFGISGRTGKSQDLFLWETPECIIIYNFFFLEEEWNVSRGNWEIKAIIRCTNSKIFKNYYFLGTSYNIILFQEKIIH